MHCNIWHKIILKSIIIVVICGYKSILIFQRLIQFNAILFFSGRDRTMCYCWSFIVYACKSEIKKKQSHASVCVCVKRREEEIKNTYRNESFGKCERVTIYKMYLLLKTAEMEAEEKNAQTLEWKSFRAVCISSMMVARGIYRLRST